MYLSHRLLVIAVALLSSCLLYGANKPILVVGSSSNPFSFYNAEILQAEGLNAFDTADLAAVTAATLSEYDVVVLGQVELTSSQAAMLTLWVNNGGHLVAMRPDKQLASLFGITDTGTTLSDGYLLTDTSRAPGAGIVGQAIQFHGTADLYAVDSATRVATLYSSRTTPTSNPAVTLRTGIGSGGKAAAFLYDLARSVVYTRQGNPAWAGQARVRQGGPIRAGDMFYGNSSTDPQPDWVDLNNIAIPQADEQQRLLVNLILHLNESKKPLPRFWYFPFGKKAVVIMTGDDHARGATAGRFDDYLAKSPAGCSLGHWECIRGSSYIYPSTPLTNVEAATYHAQGFEIGLHVSTNCADYTRTSLESFFSSQLGSFAAAYPGLPAPTTNRTHCIAYSDWSGTPEVERSHGIRLDTNYYHWPPSWVVPTPGFFTGSGIPMRLAQTSGQIIDVYQATTQMTDESGQAYPATVDGLLDNAIGAAGYYGAFTANMHTDSNSGDSKLWSDQIVSSAVSRGVPVVSARQMLQWLDARNGSSFTVTSWNSNALSFSIAAAGMPYALQGMLPGTSTAGTLSSLTREGVPASFFVQTIKGIPYAFFAAAPGAYLATYGNTTPPVITQVQAAPGATTATITWTTDKNSNSRVDYGTSPSSLALNMSDAAMTTSHSVSLTGLTAGATYYFRVTSVDSTNGSATSPGISSPAATFTTVDPTPPVISAVSAQSGVNGSATITWTTNKASSSRVDYGRSAGTLDRSAAETAMRTAHRITLTGLTSGTTYYFRVSSADAAGNSATAPAAQHPPASFQQTDTVSIWGPSAVPANPDVNDRNSVELGVKFRSDVAGFVTSIRFYKSAANTGVHVGNLWSSTGGPPLARVTFTGETASGWQQANFDAPVAIAANTTYIASYFAPNGHYASDSGFFTSGVDASPLHPLADGVDGSNGVYRYGSSSGFPNQSYRQSNYWVDVVFTVTDNRPLAITALRAKPGANGTAEITWTTSKLSNSRVDYGTSAGLLVQNASDAAITSAHRVILTGLLTGSTYYFRVTSTDASNNSITAPASPDPPESFRQVHYASIWEPSVVPASPDVSDPNSVELGMKFRSDVAGFVTGIRFHKSAANTGTHIGNLWSSTGAPLARVTFTGETASGWQQANFDSPVSISANTTYIVSYFAPNGHYSGDEGYFASQGSDAAPLHALANGLDGPNGVYRYGLSSTFPNQSYNQTNYWVDVVYTENDVFPPVIRNLVAVAENRAATITWSTNEAASSRIDYGTSPSSLSLNVSGASRVTDHRLSLTGLTNGATYYYRAASADAAGNSGVSPDASSEPATFVPTDIPAPVITGISATPGSTSAIISWTTDVASTSRVDYGTAPAALTQSASGASNVTSHSVALEGLNASTSYYFRVTSVSGSGRSAQAPEGAPASFVTTSGTGGEAGSPPVEWDISGAGDSSIQGYPTELSVNKGETVSFKINTSAAAYTINIYRMGYYNGNGAARIATVSPSASLPQSQPSCTTVAETGLIDCGNWAVSASWAVPATTKSGIYFARLQRTDTGGASHIFFVVRDDASTSDILFQTADTTWQAYNRYGGNSLYVGAPAGRAYKVSYNRPITTRSYAPEDFIFNSEYPMVRWLEANGYNVSYTTGIDSDRRGNLIRNHKLFLSVGHDEYWSGAQRANVQAARDAGTHLAFFSGNEVYWKTRWEDNHRTLVCYKETHANAKIDPSGIWTGTWRDPRFSPPADGGRPENELTGTLFTVNAGPSSLAVEVPAADGKMRFWRNTGLQSQAPGAAVTLTSGTLGYEWDEEVDNGSRPAGMIHLSTTESAVSQKLLDYGSTYGSGVATHHTTLYRAPGGALVFGGGTVQWSWGLNANHDRGNNPADLRMQQAIVNLFADMGIQPASLQPGLIPAVGSSDTVAPTVTITSPAEGASVASGVAHTISGTATDSGGGVVGSVEVSFNGGLTWRRAAGRESWSYTWTPGATGPQTIQVRAIDDSLNVQSQPATRTVMVTGTSSGSLVPIWPSTAMPAIPSDPNRSTAGLGLKFCS